LRGFIWGKSTGGILEKLRKLGGFQKKGPILERLATLISEKKKKKKKGETTAVRNLKIPKRGEPKPKRKKPSSVSSRGMRKKIFNLRGEAGGKPSEG